MSARTTKKPAAKQASKKKPAGKAPAAATATKKAAPKKPPKASAAKPAAGRASAAAKPARPSDRKSAKSSEPRVAERTREADRSPKTASKSRTAPKATRPTAMATAPAKKKTTRSVPKRKSTVQYDHLRPVLLEKQRELIEAYSSAKDGTLNRQPDGTEDYIDYAVSSYDREFLLSMTELEQRELRLVEEALRRLDRGEYGRCLQCGQEIPVKRLEVQPWARYCVTCQELEDQGLLEEPDFDPVEEDEEEAEPLVRGEEAEVEDDEEEEEVKYDQVLEADESDDIDEEESL